MAGDIYSCFKCKKGYMKKYLDYQKEYQSELGTTNIVIHVNICDPCFDQIILEVAKKIKEK